MHKEEIPIFRRPWYVGLMISICLNVGNILLGPQLKPHDFRWQLMLLVWVPFAIGIFLSFGRSIAWKLSLRDLFLLTLVTGVGIGWLVERGPLVKELRSTKGYRRFYFTTSSQVAATNAQKRAKLLHEVRGLGDEELQRRLRDTTKWWGDALFNCCLIELERRGSSEALRDHHDRMYAESFRRFGGFQTWPSLTVLRRSQQRPDPLQIHVDFPVPRADKEPAAPILSVSIQNVDVEGQPFVFAEVGTENHGRQEHARVYLTTEAGEVVPSSNFDVTYEISDFGDKTRYSSRLEKGQRSAEPYRVDMRKYLSPPPTGNYLLHVEVSDSMIADQINLDGYIICRSVPIPVRVENRLKPTHRHYAVYPVVIVLAIGANMLGFGFFQKLRRQGETPEPLPQFADWRGLLALAIAAVLACGWFLNIHSLEAEIERIRPDDEADWSLTRVE